MFSTVIVGVDGREGGRDALALGERLRAIFSGDLIAVNAYPYDWFVNRGDTADVESVMHSNADDMVAGELEHMGVDATGVAMPDGSPARALHKAAKRHDGSVIVVGSDQHGPIGRVLAGDVTLGTLHGARCPVIVAPRRYAEYGKDLETDRRRLRRIARGARGRPPRTRPGRCDRRAAARDLDSRAALARWQLADLRSGLGRERRRLPRGGTATARRAARGARGDRQRRGRDRRSCR